MSIQNDKKVVLITGCSSGGLGAALALALHRTNKYRVIATARNPAKLTETNTAGIESLPLDVQSPSSISAAATSLASLTNNRLDMLINNAGAGYNMPILDASLTEVQKVFDLNVFSLITVTRAFLPMLLQTPGAMIVNQISVAAYVAMPFQGTYNASKAAANMISESMRLELAPFGVKVVALITAAVQTKFFENAAAAAATGAQRSGQDTAENTLPDDSIFRVVPGGLKMLKDPEAILFKNAVKAENWADQVVKDLGRKNPPKQIWKGGDARAIRVLSVLPTGWVDGQIGALAGVDEVEKAIRERRQ